MSRTRKLARNSIFAVISYTIAIITSFVMRMFFVKVLGYKLLGLQAVLITFVGTLSLVELGIGTAITYLLYKPIAEKNEKKITLLINLYRKIYRIIGLIILVIGLAVSPFLILIVKEFSFFEMIFPYLIVLSGTVLTYFFSFNHTLLMADQNNFIISISNTFSKIITFTLQILVLLLINNFVLFIAISVLISFAENILLSLVVRIKYPFINIKATDRFTSDEIKLIKTKVIALMYHKIGNHIFLGINNILISIFLGAVIVGYFSNYTLISTSIVTLIGTISTGLLATFGNLVATEKIEKFKSSLMNATFVFLLIYSIVLSGLFVLANQFITLWLNEEAILPLGVVFLWALNIFIDGYTVPIAHLRFGAGLFEPEKYLHFVLIIVSLTIAIVSVHFIGLAGILLATTVCLILKHIIVIPHVTYKYIFKQKTFEFYRKIFFDFLLVAGIVASCFFLNKFINTGRSLLDFVYGIILCTILPTVIILIVYIRSNALKYLINMIRTLLSKRNKLPPLTPQS